MLIDHFKPTYTAASAAFTPGATPDDVFTITGSATKIIYVVRMGISCTQTTAGLNSWFIRKRSTANSGGTSAAVAAVSHDGSNAAASATVLQYTADPTLGTPIGDVWSGWINSPVVTTASIGEQGVVVPFWVPQGEPIILRGTGSVLSWCFNNAALPAGLSLHCYVTWYEL